MEVSDISTIHAHGAEAALRNAKPADSKDPEKLKDATEQFEAILIRQYLSEAMKPLFEDSMMGNAAGSHMYQYMITDAMASELSRGSTFGMASMLQMQLAGPSENKSDSSSTSKINDE